MQTKLLAQILGAVERLKFIAIKEKTHERVYRKIVDKMIDY